MYVESMDWGYKVPSESSGVGLFNLSANVLPYRKYAKTVNPKRTIYTKI